MKSILIKRPDSIGRIFVRNVKAVCLSAALLCSSLMAAAGLAQMPADNKIANLPYAQAAIDATGYNGTLLIYDLNDDQYYASDKDSVLLQQQVHANKTNGKSGDRVMLSLIHI